ncbi:MAG: tetratricopeptide repeat protein [Deltaproteobacteria bacterium]|nr:MAG: tetratricopeptide repeat protein [Deltaproteobacteria bacterium]
MRRSIELEPGDADAWSNLARLQRMNGQEEASRASQRRADELASAQRANTR